MSLSKLIQIFVHVQASHSDLMLKSKAERNDSAVQDQLEDKREALKRALVQLLFLSRDPRDLN